MRINGGIVSILLFLLFIACSCQKEFPHGVYDYEDKSMSIALSQDTILFDTIPSLFLTSTQEVKIYNTNKKDPIFLKRIYLKNDKASDYQINIDGNNVSKLDDVKIAARDSVIIFIRAYFKETTVDKPQLVEDSIVIEDNRSNSTSIHIIGYRQNVVRIDNKVYSTNEIVNYPRPILLNDSIIIEKDAVLTLAPNTKIYMMPKAYIRVKGSLIIDGNSSNPVYISSIRRDNLIPDVSYSVVPGQFRGLLFSETSKDNRISYLRIDNGQFGLFFEDAINRPNNVRVLSIDHSKITNFSGEGVRLSQGEYDIQDCEISNTLGTTLLLTKGRYSVYRTSIINLYSWKGFRVSKAVVYNDENGSEVSPLNSVLYMTNCVVDGSFALNYNSSKDTYTAGECSFVLGKNSEVILSDSYMSIPTFDNKNIHLHNIVRPSRAVPIKDVFFSIGLDEDEKKNYIYNYSPLPTAPFANLGVGSTTLDLNGESRGNIWPYGCYIIKEKKK